MYESVPREVAQGYINGYFKKKYRINEKMQPNFWEAVMVLCENKDADISSLIDEDNERCIIVGSRDMHYVYGYISSVEKDVKNLSDFAKKIADQIIKRESTPISSLEFFILQKQVESMSRELLNVQARQPKRYK